MTGDVIAAGIAAEPRDEPVFRLSEVTGALSHALDLTEGQPLGHSQRSCMLALAIADRMGLESEDRRDLFYAVLLKDAGCTTSAGRIFELFRADDRMVKRAKAFADTASLPELLSWIARSTAPDARALARSRALVRAVRGLALEGRQMAATRCERGAEIVVRLGFSPAAAEAVRALSERWDGSGTPRGLKGREIPLLARITSVAQTAEVFATADGPRAARDVVARRRGRWFDPEAADAFLSITPTDPLWASLVDESLTEALAALEPEGQQVLADAAALDRVAEAFADVIDAKSPFTARHSRDVARYAVAIGYGLGLAEGEVRVLRRAGLLHDIGKLGVSNAILDKPGRLTDAEFAEVRRHPLYTEHILGQVSAFEDIAPIAAAHHERLDGRGYHRGRAAEDLTVAMRTLTCADVYDALTARRPYRDPMDPDDALALMWRDAGTAFCPVALDALRRAVAEGRAEPTGLCDGEPRSTLRVDDVITAMSVVTRTTPPPAGFTRGAHAPGFDAALAEGLAEAAESDLPEDA